ncbi:AAA family ATPase [Rhizomonospora bruguierae]|uniref:AAA family ATPase n=1 Tax=Rhizomonospora bruguierae TaxID=1581705 RepID=UPI001BCE6112|nr:AAA family ATPase [Micromonospora sp. NBRC 107566]
MTRVRIENYRSIAHCDLALGPFAVLLGLNAAGKSNFLDALRFVRDALDHGLGAAVKARGGLDDVLRRVPEPTESATIALEVRLPGSAEDDGPGQARYEVTISRSSARNHAGLAVWSEREYCEIGPASGKPQARFLVEDGKVSDSAGPHGGRLHPGSLYLPRAGVGEPYARLYEALTAIFFYEPDLAALRDARPATGSDLLDENGGHLGAILGQLGRWERERVSAYAGVIVPRLVDVGPSTPGGDYIAARMATATGPGGEERHFRAESMSEGTIRAVGLLTALFQPGARDGRIPLVAVEEPELALHPMAAGVLFDALTEASTWTQVLATSQSAELFDRKEADLSTILVAAADNGVTTIDVFDLEMARRNAPSFDKFCRDIDYLVTGKREV